MGNEVWTLDQSGWPLIINQGDAIVALIPLPEGSTGDDEAGLRAVRNATGMVEAHNQRISDATLEALQVKVTDVFWDYLKRDPDHKDRRRTGWGTKTKQGLARTIHRIVHEAESTVTDPETDGEVGTMRRRAAAELGFKIEEGAQ